MIKEIYDRFVAEIETQKGIKVGSLTLTDENGIVSIKIIPALQEIAMNFTDSGETSTSPTPDPTVTEDSSTTEDAVVIEWGDATVLGTKDEITILAESTYNVYRSSDDKTYTKVGSGTSAYRDTTVLSGSTYYYYIVPVNADGTEGIPSNKVQISLTTE